jgi:glycosyltransferase involved in cell wall biosynthesis
MKSSAIHPWQHEALIKNYQFNFGVPLVTLVIPVFNQQHFIYDRLLNTCQMTKSLFDLIVINDGSDDKTGYYITDFFLNSACCLNNLISATYVHNPVPIYETACNNQGFKLANTEFIIEVQSDIIIKEYAYDMKMITVASQTNIGTVSGRHIHQFSLIDGRLSWFKYPVKKIISKLDPFFESAGLIDNLIFSGCPVNIKPNCYYTGETNSRGPWLVRKSHLKFLNYLDEENFFLGNDDHDFNWRLYSQLSKFAAYVSVEQTSYKFQGSTRKQRLGINKKIYEYLLSHKTGSYDFKKFLIGYRPFLKTKEFKLPGII